jgi:hypothetical protein
MSTAASEMMSELQRWHGAQGMFFEYQCSLSQLTLKLTSPEQRSLLIVCVDCAWISGPARWKCGNLEIASASRYSTVLRDPTVQLEIRCGNVVLKSAE